MTRSTKAFGLAMAGFVVCLGLLANVSVPYVLFSPGVTVNVLGTLESNGKQIIEIEGAQSYGTQGEFRMTTVSSTTPERRVLLWEAAQAWFDPDVAILPYDAIYGEGSTREEERSESRIEMVSSQETSIAAALNALGYEFESFPEIFGVTTGLPAEGRLVERDRILQVDGERVATPQAVTERLRKLKPGDDVTLAIQRAKKTKRVTLTTAASPDDPARAVVGVTVGTGYEFPLTVQINIPEQIGGPSAGLMFALSIYDTLTPGALNGGRAVAGTGTIDAAGNVGPIGGIAQKIAASQAISVPYFLVPAENCDEAATAPQSKVTKLIRVATLKEALSALKALSADPQASVPQCEEVR